MDAFALLRRESQSDDSQPQEANDGGNAGGNADGGNADFAMALLGNADLGAMPKAKRHTVAPAFKATDQAWSRMNVLRHGDALDPLFVNPSLRKCDLPKIHKKCVEAFSPQAPPNPNCLN